MDMSAAVELKRNAKIPALSSGDTVKVYVKVKEGDRERVQVFQGVVIRIKQGTTGNFTVRRVAYGIGTERTFPVNSPMVDKVEVTRHGKVRRARLFYLRGLTAKKARLKEKRVLIEPEVPAEVETTMTAAEAAPVAEAAAPVAAVTETPKAPVAAAPKAEAPKAEAPAETKASLAKYELYQDKAGEWRWRLRHQNGNIIADSAEGYSSKAAAQKGIESVKKNVGEAEIKELPAAEQPKAEAEQKPQ